MLYFSEINRITTKYETNQTNLWQYEAFFTHECNFKQARLTGQRFHFNVRVTLYIMFIPK